MPTGKDFTDTAFQGLSSVSAESLANMDKSSMHPVHELKALDARAALKSFPEFPSNRIHSPTASATPAFTLGPTYSAADLISNSKTPSIKDAEDNAFTPITTPYENSFASRLYGFVGTTGIFTTSSYGQRNLLYCDWDNKPPWVVLLEDIHAHYRVKGETIDSTSYIAASIHYVGLQRWHLNQVYDLLETVFWPGIDVTAALDDFPETYTVVAMYKRLVVGVAIISPPPDEAYITYLAVKSGWENSGIAHTMLYLLVTGSPDRDIILHVSANNPAMLLYNKFGFKAEEFVAGFYEDYLDPKSKACRNALRLRLRQR